MFFDEKKFATKAGVSLITVLLFMLVATIAATATYKWLTSEGRSSASRMLKQEAYLSSVAGIENARAWMTFHANDLGGIVSQYFANNKRPVRLTSALQPLAKAGQNYDVWLTGVSTENNVYKMQILSSGQARNGTRHSEVAILNVTGLYQVKIPGISHSSATDFDYAYYGGGFHSTQVTVTSAAVNGNWNGNPPHVTKNWVVTGNVTLSGDFVDVGGMTCVGGNASTENNGFSTTDLYVGGNYDGLLKTANGDVYFEGDAKHGGTGSINITGSLTVNGTLTTLQNASDRAITVGKNLCVNETGAVVSSGHSDIFQVAGNVWMPGALVYGSMDPASCKCDKITYVNTPAGWELVSTTPNSPCGAEVWTGIHHHVYTNKVCTQYNRADNYAHYDKLILGSSTNSSVYVKGGTPSAKYVSDLYEGKSFDEVKTYPRACDDAACNTKYWSDEHDVHPYPSRDAADDLYYIYSMPSGVKDVDFGSYVDEFWNKTLLGYFINASVNNQNTRFTNSLHNATNIEGTINIPGKGHYRYLNHDGTRITGSPYCKLADGKDWRPSCGVTPWFKSNGKVYNNVPASSPFKCAEEVKQKCFSLWTEGSGCEGSNFIVNDPLVTAYDKFISYADKGCAADINSWPQEGFTSILQTCYNSSLANHPDDLYNGFLVVDLSSTDGNYVQESTELTGNYIIVVENQLKPGQNGLLKVADGSFVFYYLKQGAKYIQKDANNSFIYTTGDIGESSGLNLYGTIYSPSSACAKADLKDAVLTYNPTLTQKLLDANIICNSDEGAFCGGTVTPSTPSPSDDGSSTLGSYDTYHISTAPQLGISLESQHASAENSPVTDSYDPIVPSIVVLPRVIYLPQDPVGKLSDYYNVVNLNGAAEEKDANNVVCNSGEINATGTLYQNDHKIAKGIYKCTYKSSQYSDMPFYVVVDGLLGSDPPIHFVEDYTEVTAGGPQVSVLLYLPKSSHGAIEVDVAMSAVPSEKWHVTPAPGVTLREGNLYKVTATPSATGPNTIPLFTVKVDEGAENNGILFSLATPCKGCVISSPSTDYVYMTGTATVNLGSLAQYCAVHTEECTTYGYTSKIERPDCSELVSGEWVKAAGLNCRTIDENSQWTCGTNMAITLQGASGVPSYCELIVPSGDNNRIANPEDNESYTLYASLKRRPFDFTVKKSGAKNGATKLNVYFATDGTFSDTPDDVCTENTCTYSVYAGNSVKVTYEESGEDNFSYWTCSGGNCPSANYVQAPTYVVSQITSSNTVTAKFNDVDKHCFYEDFNGLGAFCASGQTRCIADCSNAHCSVTSSTAEDWQLIYKNGGNGNNKPNVAPTIEDGSITGGSGKNNNNSSGNQTVVLSSKNAGANGTINAFMKIPISSKNNNATVNEFLNSGLIFRSNADASDYSILNFYALSNGTLRIRVCKETGQGTNNSNGGCLTRDFQTIHAYTNSNMASVHVELDGETLRATVSIDGSSETLELNIANYSNANNQYVGMKLSDPAFVLYDIGWESASFPSEGCWAVPTVNCSFKANYLGGLVPLNEDVSPWVSLSSWFTNNGCTEEYYYTGNDNQSSQTTDDNYGHKLSSSTYNFNVEGAHGPEDKDAKVSASCPADLHTSLDNNAVSCGAFWVGQLTHCSDNLSLITSDQFGTGNQDLVVNLDEDGLNMREATLFVEIADLTVGKQVTVRLKDVNNRYSLPTTLNSNATHSLDVDIMSDAEGFDPQRVTDIVFNSDVGYKVKSARTTCPYALSLSNCTVSYNGTSWVVSTQINNVEGAAENGCSVTSTGSDIDDLTDVACPLDGKFTITDGSFYTRLNSSTLEQTVSFTISAKKSPSNEVVTCTATATYTPVTVSCNVPEGSSVVQGQGVPSVSYSIENCPSEGCPYTLSLSTSPVTTAEGVYRGTSDETWAPNLNVTTSLPVGTGYAYSITTMGKTESCGSFSVVAPSPASVSACSIVDGEFTATIVPATDGSPWSASMVVASPLGNTIAGTSQSIQSSTASSWTVTLPTMEQQTNDVTYYVNMTLNGETVTNCAPSWTVTGSGGGDEPDPLSCSSTAITNQDPTSAITINPLVTGCTASDPCSYSVSPATADASGEDYAGGTITFYNVNGTGNTPVQHTLTLTRGTASTTCNFNITFSSSSTEEGCHCEEYCSKAQCSSLRVSGSLRFDGNCYFATSISYMNGEGYTINGKSYSGYKSSGFGDAVDGGYYITSTKGNYGSSVTLGTPTPGCSSYYVCTKKKCIAFVNNVGGYSQNCYSSGLTNHASGTCYALQDGREDALSINSTATDTYWWKVVDCDDFCI